MKQYHIIILSLFSIIFSSCENKPFQGIKYGDDSYKLYCFAIPFDSSYHRINHFYEDYKNFYITDTKSLEILSNEILGDKTFEQTSSNSLYAFRLVKDKEIIDGGIMDAENGKFFYINSKYEFDIDKFKQQKNYFNKLNSFKINTKTISNAKKFLGFVEQTNGFIYNYTKDGKNPIIGFNGKTEVLTDTSTINMNFTNGWEDIENQIKHDFKNVGKIRILNASYLGGDTITFSLLTEKDFSNQLPSGYKIQKAFSDSIDLPILLYDVEKSKIVEFFEKNGIMDYEIEDLNKKNYW